MSDDDIETELRKVAEALYQSAKTAHCTAPSLVECLIEAEGRVFNVLDELELRTILGRTTVVEPSQAQCAVSDEIDTALKTLQDLPCPECVDGSGGIQVSETEVVQCRWCDEREQALSVIRQQGWQPIETAPKTSKARLVYVPGIKCTFAVTWHEDKHESGWIIFGGGSRSFLRQGSPTHWMPLPDPPTTEKSNE